MSASDGTGYGPGEACKDVDDVLAALIRLVRCPDLNLESLDDETVAALEQAHAAIEGAAP